MKRIQKKSMAFFMAGICFVLAGCFRKGPPMPQAVEKVQWAGYLGKWYEIARLPNAFQNDRESSFAVYSYDEKAPDRIKVVNTAEREGKTISSITGVAKFLPGKEREKGILRVSFQWPFYGEYRIIFLSEDHGVSVVTSSSRKYLWILSRTPSIPEALRQELLAFLQKEGFDTGRLIFRK